MTTSLADLTILRTAAVKAKDAATVSLAEVDKLIAREQALRPKLGGYVGHVDLSGVAPFTTFMGRAPFKYLVFGDRRGWAEFNSNLPWMGDVWKSVPQPLVWSVPLIVEGANFTDALAGKYDGYWRKAATDILAKRGNETEILIRIWEFNADWYPWSAVGKEALFASVYQRFHGVFRSVSAKFRFDWCPNIGEARDITGTVNLETCYPGDSFVDTISMDAYFDKQWDTSTATVAFERRRGAIYGFDWLARFAKAHGKPWGFDEWAINQDAPDYIQLMAAWMSANGCGHQFYWQNNSAFAGHLDQYPMSKAAFKLAFA